MTVPESSAPETETATPPPPALRADVSLRGDVPPEGAAPGEASSRHTLLGKRGGETFFYGGQAVIEGVMMRGKKHYAVAVRLPNTKEIVVDRGELKASIYVNPIWKLPFVRGLALIGEQLHLGMK